MKHVICLAGTCLLLSCGGGGQSANSTASTSISPFTDPAIPEWTLARRPERVIGDATGVSLYRPVAGVILSDRIVVANNGTHQVLLLSAAGRLAAAQGRQGKGPGEYDFIEDLVKVDDETLAVWDPPLARVTVLHIEDDGFEVEKLIAVSPPRVSLQGTRLVGAVGGQFLLFEERPGELVTSAPPGRAFQTRRDTLTYAFVDIATGRTTATWNVPGTEEMAGARQGVWGDEPLLFGRATYATTTENRAVIASSDTFVVTIIDPTSRRVPNGLRYSFDFVHPALSGEVVNAERERLLAENRERWSPSGRLKVDGRPASAIVAEFREELIEALPARRTLPAFSALDSDADGNIWIRAYPLPRADSVHWVILDPRIGFIGRILLPRDIEILDIGFGRLLVRSKDALGTDVLELRQVRRS
ncbi:MAG TPA: hypothetical protein VF188_14510 [Longimicrobiales bacterium]